MTKADEIVKARLAAQHAREAAREVQTREEEIETWTQYLCDAIPRLLTLLEARDYPDAVLLQVSNPGRRSPFSRKPRSVEVASWLLDDDRWEEGGSTVHLASDGRLVWRSVPTAVSEIRNTYSETGARELLQRASKGVRKLLNDHGGDAERS